MEERLQKVIAAAGVTSRRKAENLILQGQVTVNGEVIKTLGVKVSADDNIEVMGVPIKKERHHTFLLYKPRGVVSTVRDDKERKTVIDLVPEPYRLYPVGRLDYDTSGALLLTNDGELANLLMHPKGEVEKQYTAKVQGIILDNSAEVKQLRRGVLVDGKKTAPAKVRVVSNNHDHNTSVVSLIIHEGRYHQVKKMFQKIGHPVLKLSRERYAFLDLQSLMAGQYRELSKTEVAKLRELVVE
ncbi:ribosomal large subunit pseudouridine synthase B [Amylolactobacillus amylotrophicus DSM 20534]|uniref:Pseudouridine synthase n=3 Tax=Amylolactobacillus TaxID=2767876 RepID=A0A1L6XDY3_9LACO|nr:MULTISPECIES: pseudouridine synthase [Amylolactobacillus]APT19165.1 pseudouridine synthase [Amylolactobacillus amylophilus DSM 20533 = JCM 1125]KRK38564.1 ribosomal large subunit pseudouridine synthase B [Amylolactobacillus amylotrophicus DSM 20534]KRM42793.1 ribosomal large subunit pseudouridine synthase B [Amylolactobacillus amylophilus DSM 20533 = JCM 1125]GED79656.1 pseudouridine synthase [Amylolactobacillus amylophilus]